MWFWWRHLTNMGEKFEYFIQNSARLNVLGKQALLKMIDIGALLISNATNEINLSSLST